MLRPLVSDRLRFGSIGMCAWAGTMPNMGAASPSVSGMAGGMPGLSASVLRIARTGGAPNARSGSGGSGQRIVGAAVGHCRSGA
jgi:hypothetical protein